jgi:hypothetical protein
MGLLFTIVAGPHQRSHSRIRVSRDSWPYFTVLYSRVSQLGGTGPRIYIPQKQDGLIIPPGTGFPFRRLLRLAGLPGRSSHTAWDRSHRERRLQRLFYCCVTSLLTCLSSRSIATVVFVTYRDNSSVVACERLFLCSWFEQICRNNL